MIANNLSRVGVNGCFTALKLINIVILQLFLLLLIIRVKNI